MENIESMRPRLAKLANELATLRSRESELLTKRRGMLPLHPHDILGSEDLRAIDLEHARIAGRARDLETEVAEAQRTVAEHDMREQVRQRLEAAKQRDMDVAVAGSLVRERIAAAQRVDVAFAELGEAFSRFENIGNELARLESVTGISSQQLHAKPSIKMAAVLALPDAMRRALDLDTIHGRRALAEAQAEMFTRLVSPLASAAE